ncbi:MAG: SIS domain-containing protein [Elusimicrobia bacterium]|nr:SIS domain-containing protein [Elusimicrobiota bacterium]
MNNTYFKQISALLEDIESTQTPAMQKAAAIIAQTMECDGIIYTFGAGHSHSAAVENFHRSGCPACVSAILDPALSFMPSAHAATDLERLEGFSPVMLKRHNMRPDDAIIIISNSGRNPAGIDTALYAKEKGLKVIVITALSAHKESKSRHSCGKTLKDLADVVIDDRCSKQETALACENSGQAPVSTIACAAIINSVISQAVKTLEEKGFKTPVYSSSNAEGGDENNAELAEKYKNRILHLC